jgi:hypothetical protein
MGEGRGLISLHIALFLKWVSSLRKALWHFGQYFRAAAEVFSLVFFERYME